MANLGAPLARILENVRAIDTLTTACRFLKVPVLLKRTLMTCNRKYTEDFSQRQRIKRKKLATLHRVIFRVVFSLLLAFLGPLEALPPKKCTECRCSTLVDVKGKQIIS